MSKVDDYFKKLKEDYEANWKDKFKIGDIVINLAIPEDRRMKYIGKITNCLYTHAEVTENRPNGLGSPVTKSLVPYTWLEKIE